MVKTVIKPRTRQTRDRHVSILAFAKPYNQVEEEGRRLGREVDVIMLHIHD